MQQRVTALLVQPGRAAEDHDGGPLRERLGGGVGQLEPADPVGHADRPQPAKPGIGVGREACPLLVTGGHELQRTGRQPLAQLERVIARHAEDMADAALEQRSDKIIRDADRSEHLRGPQRAPSTREIVMIHESARRRSELRSSGVASGYCGAGLPFVARARATFVHSWRRPEPRGRADPAPTRCDKPPPRSTDRSRTHPPPHPPPLDRPAPPGGDERVLGGIHTPNI
jgi:hypothetical protein